MQLVSASLVVAKDEVTADEVVRPLLINLLW